MRCCLPPYDDDFKAVLKAPIQAVLEIQSHSLAGLRRSLDRPLVTVVARVTFELKTGGVYRCRADPPWGHGKRIWTWSAVAYCWSAGDGT